MERTEAGRRNGALAKSSRIPRFLLNVRDGNYLAKDVEGTDFPNLEAARAEALAAARQLIGTR